MSVATEWTVTIRDADAKVAFKRAGPARDAQDALRMTLEDMGVAWASLVAASGSPPRETPVGLARLSEAHESADAPRWTCWRLGSAMTRAAEKGAKTRSAPTEAEPEARDRIQRAFDALFDHEMDLNGIPHAARAQDQPFAFLKVGRAGALASLTDEMATRMFKDNATLHSLPMRRETEACLLSLGVSYLVARRAAADQDGERFFYTSKIDGRSATLSAAHAAKAPQRRAAYLDVIGRMLGHATRQEATPC